MTGREAEELKQETELDIEITEDKEMVKKPSVEGVERDRRDPRKRHKLQQPAVQLPVITDTKIELPENPFQPLST